MKWKGKACVVLLFCVAALVFGGGTEESAAASDEPVEVLIIGRGASVATHDGVQTDMIAKEIERLIGVKWNFGEITGVDMAQTIVASGDLPDILQVVETSLVEPMIEAGHVKDMDPYLDKLPNIVNNASTMINYSRQHMSAGTGGFYAIMNQVIEEQIGGSPIGPYLLMDYLEELNYPEINDLYDVLDVLAEMVKRHPENADGQKVYGVTMWHDWGLFGYVIIHQQINGVMEIDPNRMYMVDLKGAKYERLINPLDDDHPMWLDGKWYNTAHRMGILDPETFTQNYEAALQKYDSFRIICPLLSWTTYKPISLRVQEGGKGYVRIMMSDAPQYSYLKGETSPFGSIGHIMFVSEKTKVLDAVLRYLDFIYSEEGARIMLSGIEGVHWERLDGGKIAAKDEYIDQLMNNPTWIEDTGIRKWGNYLGINGYDGNGQPFNVGSQPDVAKLLLHPFQREYYELQGYQTEDEIWDARKSKVFINGALNAFIPTPPTEITRVDSMLSEYLYAALAELWLAEDDAEFNRIKAEIKSELIKMGIEGQIEYWEGALASSREAIAKLK